MLYSMNRAIHNLPMETPNIGTPYHKMISTWPATYKTLKAFQLQHLYNKKGITTELHTNKVPDSLYSPMGALFPHGGKWGQ